MARSAAHVLVLSLALLPLASCFLSLLQELNITAKGQNWQDCMVQFATVAEASNLTAFQDIRDNATARPLWQYLDDQLSEQARAVARVATRHDAPRRQTRRTQADQSIIWRKINVLERNMILMIEELYKRLDDAVTVISTQSCDLKTQVADVQRETNYLRYVMLTPESKRPRFRRSTQECSVTKPETCEQPVTKKPVQPAVFDPPAACMVSDGVRQYDLTQGSEP